MLFVAFLQKKNNHKIRHYEQIQPNFQVIYPVFDLFGTNKPGTRQYSN